MRQLIVQVPSAYGDHVVGTAHRHHAVNVVQLRGTDAEGQDIALVVLHLTNDRAGHVIGELESVPGLRISMLPSSALALHPPASHASEQTTDVSARSPLEVFVAGLQSIRLMEGISWLRSIPRSPWHVATHNSSGVRCFGMAQRSLSPPSSVVCFHSCFTRRRRPISWHPSRPSPPLRSCSRWSPAPRERCTCAWPKAAASSPERRPAC